MNNSQDQLLKKIINNNAKDISYEIFEFLLDDGLGSISKSEFDAFIFYTLHKYQKKNKLFLSNYEWSSLLKLTERKIKNLRLISGIRFAEDTNEESKELWFNFLDIVREGYIQVDKSKNFIFTIEDPILTRFLDAKLKELKLSSFDYSFNSEILKFNSKSLSELLKNAASETGIGEGNSIAEEKITKIKWKNVGDEAKDLLKDLLKGLFPTLIA